MGELADVELAIRADTIKSFRGDPFALVASGLILIRDKQQRLVPLKLNRVQRHFLGELRKDWFAGVPVRAIVCKARQQGISTIAAALFFAILITRRNLQAMICADSQPNSEWVFSMVKTAQEYINRQIKISPELISDNRRVMAWRDEEGTSGALIDNSRNKNLGVSKTIHLILQDELSRHSRAAEIEAALIPAVPDLPETIWLKVSTAYGAGGLYYSDWKRAIAGETSFKPYFYPWFATEEYRIQPLPAGFKATPDELEIIERYKDDQWGPISLEQIAWRRAKIREYMRLGEDGERKFRENFPGNWQEAFLVSGNLVLVGCGEIAQKQASKLEETYKKEPPMRGNLTEQKNGRITFTPEESGILTVFEPPHRGEEYVIGADVGEGLSTSCYSTASVFSGRTRDQVAIIRCRYPTDVFSDELRKVGLYYNEALLAPETNSIGMAVVSDLRGRYDNLFHTRQLSTLTFQKTDRWGWYTSTGTLPMMERRMAKFIREEVEHLRDPITLDEVLSYVVNEESGEHEPREGNYSDLLIASMIAVMLLETVEGGQAEKEPEDYKAQPQPQGQPVRRRGVVDMGSGEGWESRRGSTVQTFTGSGY